MEIESLKLRSQVMPTIQKFGAGSPEMDSLDQKILRFDSMALAVVTAIIDQYGWLSQKQIGEAGNRALFLAIQHAPDSALRNKYFPYLMESVEKGGSPKWTYATMRDRMLVESGQLQMFGTQSRMVDDELKPYPILDPANVNKRRKAAGLKKMKKPR